jgi:hypothetical protein
MQNNYDYYEKNSNLSISLFIHKLDEYKKYLIDEISIHSFLDIENSYQEIDKNTIDNYIKKNKSQKIIPENLK